MFPPCPVLQVWPKLRIGPGPLRTPSLPARTVNSSPRSHNVRATWCGAVLGLPILLPLEAWGWKAGGPSSLFQGGGHPVSTVSVLPSPGLPIQARGRACLGDPSPSPNLCLSLCLFAVCTRLGVLTLVLTVNVNRPILRVPLDTRTAVSTLSVHHIPRLANPPTAAAMNAGINTYRGSHSV